MAYELFLIAEPDVDATTTIARLENILGTAQPSVLLIPTGTRDPAAYADHVETLLPYAQRAGCAVLLDNRPDLVRALAADGVHMSGGIKALGDAVADLRPDFIVGTGDIGSRHEAMLRGEMDVDYLMFGDRAGEEAEGAEMARWWAQTFEIPTVYRAAGVDDPALENIGTEFVALAAPDWEDPAKLKTLKGLAQ